MLDLSPALVALSIGVIAGVMGTKAIGAEQPELSGAIVLEADPPLKPVAEPLTNVLAQDYLPEDLPELFTPVSQLQNLDPQHWAVEALRQLSQRYNCLTPDLITDLSDSLGKETIGKETVLSRYPFANLLRTCLDIINQRIQELRSENITPEDLAIVQRIQEEFATELKDLPGQIDSLGEQLSILEAQQFVRRTTLFGTAEFVLLDTFSESVNTPIGRRPTPPIPNANTTLSTGNILLEVENKVRGQDFIRVGLFYSNIPANGRADTGTDMTRLNALPSSEGNVTLNNLFYQTRYGQRGILRVGPVGLVANVILPDLSPVRANSRFGARSPIYRPGSGAGFLTNYQLNDWLALGGAYTVGGGDAEDPSEGFFNGQHRFMAQATFTPLSTLGVALTYSHLYLDDAINITGLTGSRNAQAPFGDTTTTSAHLLSLQGNYHITKRVGIGGWINYAQARAQENRTILDPARPRGTPIGVVRDGDRAESWNWAVGMSVTDMFRKGNELGFIFGMPPKTVSNDFAPFEDKASTSYHAEVYYRHQITPRFFITQGLYAVFNPEHQNNNPTQVVGVVRSFMRF